MVVIFLGIALLAMYVINYLVSATMLLGISMADLAVVFPFDFMPPGRAFGLSRGVIFVGLAGSFILLAYQYFRHHKLDTHYVRLFLFSIVANIAWLVAIGQGRYMPAVAIIGLFWAGLYALLYHLKTVGQIQGRPRGAWGIYYGRVTVATWTLSTSQAAYLYHPSITSDPRWLRVVVVMTSVVIVLSYLRLRNIYALVWSFAAIAIALWTTGLMS